jgi:two-component system LytT family response regulator
MAFRVLIVDDEALARKRVRLLLEREVDFEVVGECSNGAEATAAIRDLKPDVVFLDVQMPGLGGFEVIERVGVEQMPTTVFVTAFDEHALRAFDAHALDYLLKPFDADRFQQTLNRIRSRPPRNRELVGHLSEVLQALAPAQHYPSTLVVRSGPRLLIVDIKDVIALTGEGNYVRVHTGKKSYLLRETMASLEERLDPTQFVRIHRSTIVRISSIASLESVAQAEYKVVLRNGARFATSRTYRARLERACGIGRGWAS